MFYPGLLIQKDSTIDTTVISNSDSIRQNLKEASFSDTVRETQFLYFSNNEQKDKFELKVLPGLLSKSISILTIFSKDQVIYSDTFDTNYFVRFIFEPDTVPQTVDHQEYQKYIDDYVKSLTKDRFEKYTLDHIRQFFNEIIVDNKSLKEMTDFGVIENEELYNYVIADTSIKIINLPCFSCDEGQEYYVYSYKERKAIRILSAD